MASAIGKVTRQTQHMTPDQLEAYGQKEYERLQRVHGEKLEERLQLAARMVHDLDTQHPPPKGSLSLKDLLQSRGIGDTALVVNLLIGQAANYHARKQAQGR